MDRPLVQLDVAAERAIVAHARRESPAECCGLLIGGSSRIVDAVAARNLAEDTAREYLVDPHDHLRAIRAARAGGLEVVGAYHSHPRSAAAPSPTDAATAFSDFLYLIVGLREDPPELTAWTWTNGNFTAVPLVRLPRESHPRAQLSSYCSLGDRRGPGDHLFPDLRDLPVNDPGAILDSRERRCKG